MKWAQACAFALAAISTTAGLTLPAGTHTSVIAARTVAAVRTIPVTDNLTSAVKVTASDDLGQLHLHLSMNAVASSWAVRSGDNLSLIAKNRYGTDKAWPLIYWANHKQVTWANRIQVGQILALPMPDGPIPAAPRLLEPPPPPPPAPVRSVVVTTSSRGYSSYHSTYHRVYTPAPATYRGSGGYESCVISRESGGNARAVNTSSGAGGLYQFLPSTWSSLGYSGLPQNAPVSVQRQAFQRLYAQAGTSPWSPSDGC